MSSTPIIVVKGLGKSVRLGQESLTILEGIDLQVNSGETVALVEDVVTSGGAAIGAAAILREAGLVVRDLYCVVDREEGGLEAAAAAGLALRPLFTATELGIGKPA